MSYNLLSDRIFRALPIPVLLLSPHFSEYVISQWSDAFIKLNCSSQTDLTGHPLSSAFDFANNNSTGEIVQILEQLLAQVTETGKSTQLLNQQFKIKTRSIDVAMADLEVALVEDNSGNSPTFLVSLTNIRKTSTDQNTEKQAIIQPDSNPESGTERDQRNEELEMKLLINNTEECFVLIDNKLRIVSLNQQFRLLYSKFFGQDVCKGRNILDYAQPGRTEFVSSIYKNVLKGHSEASIVTAQSDEGKTHIFSIKYKPAIDDDGIIIGIFVTARDVTEEKEIQKQLETSEEKYRLLFYRSPLPKIIYDITTLRILEANDSAISHYGYSREAFIKMSITDLDPKVSPGRITFAPARTQKHAKIDTHRKCNGELIQVEISSHQFSYQEKECSIIVCNDVTAREYALQQFRDNEVKLLNAQKIAKLGYWQQDFGSDNLYWSDEVYNIWGADPKSFKVSYEAFLDSIHPDDKETFITQQKESLNIGKEYDVEHRIILHDGSIKWVNEKGKILKDLDGKPILFEGTVQDITRQKTLALSLEQSNQRYNYLTKASSEAIWDWDLAANTLIWGEGMTSIFGYVPSELGNELSSWTNHVHPDDLDRVLGSLNDKLRTTETNWYIEYRYAKKDGKYAYVTAKGYIIRDVHENAIRMVGSMQDVTKRQEEEYNLKLLQSVITNTSDAVLITEAAPLDDPGTRILYANKAFTTMSGYSSQETLGKTPRILQGPKTDRTELDKLRDALEKAESCEITTINYKKTGEEFWVNMSVSPMINDSGQVTHFISIERDVTQRKNGELLKSLLGEISEMFKETHDLKEALEQMLERLLIFADFEMAETWLISTDQKKINKVANFSKTASIQSFYEETRELKHFKKGEGLPGIVWETGQYQFLADIATDQDFIRKTAAKKASLTSAHGVPITFNNEVIGVLIMGQTGSKPTNKNLLELFEELGTHSGAEIRRKQLEQDLEQIFRFAPDIICIVATDGYFKKINPAMCKILEYTEYELLSIPFVNFIHPDDKVKSMEELLNLSKQVHPFYFENRYVTRSGRVRWLAWTSAPSPEEGLFFEVAKDITDKKELEVLLTKANNLARIGSWEIDLKSSTVYWSEITRRIHEVPSEFMPDFATAINFFKAGSSRETLMQKVSECIASQASWDSELLIITAKGNERWVRAIGEGEFINGQCCRLYGSFQDIDSRKKAETALFSTLEEKNTILESIGDAFFAVDTNWVVTYWNHHAEKNLGKTKDEMLGHHLWTVFSDSINSLSYKKYLEAIDTKLVVHFEDYYDPMKKWYEISVYPSENGLSIYFKDVTQRKLSEITMSELNESLQKKAKELVISNTELEQFAYVASHDLQEPLRMITSFLSQLEKKYAGTLDEKGKKYIHYAVDGAKRMRQIILDLLEFSRVGKTNESKEQLDLNVLLGDILILFRKKIEEKRAIITVEDLPTIHAFKAPLRQIFQNLISNALKYSQDNKPVRILIKATEMQYHWEFSISDNGIGIEEEYFDKIFIIFQRLHNKDEFSGTGMGLAVTKKIIENMGGKIWVQSKEHEGSTFQFTISKAYL